MQADEVLIPISFFVAIVVPIIISMTNRHRERMAMIEKGLSSDEIKAMYMREVKRDPYSSLKWGILFVLAGMAILLGNFLHAQFNVDEGVIIGLICLFVGIGLVLFYSIVSKRLNQS